MKVGLALGAGGARGLAHIKIIEAFEEVGIKPSAIAGSSMGAIVGAAYSAGLTSKDMYIAVDELLSGKNGSAWDFFKKSDIIKMLDLLDPSRAPGGIIKGEKFIQYLKEKLVVNKFSELQIPLYIVATEYWTKKQKVFTRGDLYTAIRASYALPGLLVPIVVGQNLYMDGGMVNPLPYDIIEDKCDIVVAVDVSAKQTKGEEHPSSLDILFSSFQIMQHSILTEKLKRSKPTITISTDIKGVRVVEFNKSDSIFEQSERYKNELICELSKALKKKK